MIYYYRSFYSDLTKYRNMDEMTLMKGKFEVCPSIKTSSGSALTQQNSVFLFKTKVDKDQKVEAYEIYSHTPLSNDCVEDSGVIFKPERIKSNKCRSNAYLSDNSICIGRCPWGYFIKQEADFQRCQEAYPVYYNFTVVEYPTKFRLEVTSTDA